MEVELEYSFWSLEFGLTIASINFAISDPERECGTAEGAWHGNVAGTFSDGPRLQSDGLPACLPVCLPGLAAPPLTRGNPHYHYTCCSE